MTARCPNCDNLVAIGAAGCGKCGASFSGGASWMPVLWCSKCDRPFPAGSASKSSLSCAGCGATFTNDRGREVAAEAAPQPGPPPQVESQGVTWRPYPVEFTGRTGEYFRIWIVNLALTIVTLGIYSAWAKVRKRRYFYAHTRIDGECFEYRGRPLAILKGRLIAVGLLVALIVGATVFPELSLDRWLGKLVLFVVVVSVGPWLLVRSLKFNARNTAYRNVSLRFISTYGSCFRVVIKYVWFVFLGILYPYFKHQLVKYAAENHAYGATPFQVADFKKPFIRVYAVAVPFALAFVLLLLGISARTEESDAPAGVWLLATYVIWNVPLLFLAFIRARTTNAVWNAIQIGPVRFVCTLRGRDFMWLYSSNVLAILCTLGFATPWAVMRTMRYRARKFKVFAVAPLDGFASADAGQAGAAGEEIAEMFDLDVAL